MSSFSIYCHTYPSLAHHICISIDSYRLSDASLVIVRAGKYWKISYKNILMFDKEHHAGSKNKSSGDGKNVCILWRHLLYYTTFLAKTQNTIHSICFITFFILFLLLNPCVFLFSFFFHHHFCIYFLEPTHQCWLLPQQSKAI